MPPPLPILTFHTLEDVVSPISFPRDVFLQGMTRLHEAGYRTLDLTQAVDLLRLGQPIPDRSFVITFDDGYQTVYTEAFPVLQELGMTATVFLTTGKGHAETGVRFAPICNRPMLSWEEVKEMHRWGVSFGAHTMTHPDLTGITPARVELEMHRSKSLIEETLSASADAFAYPFGRFNPMVREFAAKYFACACSDNLGLASGKSDRYALERIETYYFRNRTTFDLVTSDFLKAYLRLRNVPRRLRRFFQRSSNG